MSQPNDAIAAAYDLRSRTYETHENATRDLAARVLREQLSNLHHRAVLEFRGNLLMIAPSCQRRYPIKDDHLFLSLMADGGIYEFEPVGGSKPAALQSPIASMGPVKYERTQAGGGDDTWSAIFL